MTLKNENLIFLKSKFQLVPMKTSMGLFPGRVEGSLYFVFGVRYDASREAGVERAEAALLREKTQKEKTRALSLSQRDLSLSLRERDLFRLGSVSAPCARRPRAWRARRSGRGAARRAAACGQRQEYLKLASKKSWFRESPMCDRDRARATRDGALRVFGRVRRIP